MEFLAPKRHGFFRRLKEAEISNRDIAPWHGDLPKPEHVNPLEFRLLMEEAFIPERSIDDALFSSTRPKGKAGIPGSK